MKRWHVWFLLTLLVCIPILLRHATTPALLQDTDTAFLLKIVRERHAPMSWFTGDWPLANHFYRPLPTLTFELDNYLYGTSAAGYGWTNDLLCVFSVLGLFWFLLEISVSPAWAFAGAALFSAWTADYGQLLSSLLPYLAVSLVVVGAVRHGRKVRMYAPAALVVYFLAIELAIPQTSQDLGQFMIGWLPGRTASVMTVFALLAGAAYARYERARNAWRPPKPPTATDRPATTKSGTAAIPNFRGLWLAFSVLMTACAFASYEQAVMLPAVLLGVAVYMRIMRREVNWFVHAYFWGLLFGYLFLRHEILPSGVSHYQAQQFRHGPGVWQDLSSYLVPNVIPLLYIWAGFVDITSLISAQVAYGLAAIGSTITVAVQAWRNWPTILAGWALSSLAYLPMAWLKQFGHYHYWPLALRTIFILGVGKLAWDLGSIAVCPPTRQAPPRLSPAPGSLPHR